MRKLLVYLCLFIPFFNQAQTLNPTTQKTLNNYLVCVNKSVEYSNQIMQCLFDYHRDAERFKQSQFKDRYAFKHYSAYQCSRQLDKYWFDEAFKGNLRELNVLMTDFWQALEKIDKLCKDVEIYIRLEDYKKDNMQQSDKMMAQFPILFKELDAAKNKLSQATQKIYRKSQAYNPNNPYHQAEQLLHSLTESEEILLKSWNFNFNEPIHTDWNIDLLQKDILNNTDALKKFVKNQLKYPASSMYENFAEGLRDMREIKSKAVDDYNFEAKKSDKLANQTYLDLINYYNGVLISDFNALVDFSKGDNQFLLYQTKFLNQFELKTEAQKTVISVKAFEDLPLIDFQIPKLNIEIPKDAYFALNNYIDFINEALHTSDWMQQPLLNHHQSANYRRDKDNSKYNLTYKFENFKLPKSTFQKTISESKFVPENARKSLNNQLQTLMNLMTEMDELNAELEIYTTDKKFVTDNFKRSDEILQRFVVLYDLLDKKKEKLYEDVRQVYEAYKLSQPQSGWRLASGALLENLDLQHDLLFTAKKYFKGDSTSLPKQASLDKLNQSIRNLIANEYENMKGIERIGRSNGLCPYNPYEDIPVTANNFLEKSQKQSTKPFKQNKTGYSHPYHDFRRFYNDGIEDFNKFSELAKVPILRNIQQPNLFELPLPEKPKEIIKKTTTQEEEKNFLVNMDGYAQNHLTFLLDVSSSMNYAEKLPLLKKSITFLIGLMRPEDHISLVIYSGKAEIVLQNVSSKNTQEITEAIEKLKSEGKTNSEDGLKLAYKTASKNFVPKGNNRIILATDGDFQISEKMFDLVRKNAQEDIALSVFSFGKEEKKYDNLLKLSEAGKGNYEHITQENANLKITKEAKAKKME